MGPDELNRLRWQCRRGLLELDLVLESFLEKHGEQLQGERLDSFLALLAFSDNEILDFVGARSECSDARFKEVVQLMRDCRDRSGSKRSTIR
jgi:antitoxin CptB